MKKFLGPVLALTLTLTLAACDGGSSDSGNSSTDTTSPASTDTAAPAFLSEIGKPLTALMREYPAGEFLHNPDGGAQCYGVSSEEYAYYIYESPFATIEGLPDYSGLNCAGIATTVGVLFPQATDGMTFADFFSAEGIENRGYNVDFRISFGYNNLSGELYLPAGENIPADNDAIDPHYPVVIFDESINAANSVLVDQFYGEIGYPTDEEVSDAAKSTDTNTDAQVNGNTARLLPESEFSEWEKAYSQTLSEMLSGTDPYRFRWAGYDGIVETDDVYYSFCDIDGNGTAELLFLDGNKNVLGLYTMAGGETIQLGGDYDGVASGDSNTVSIYSNGEISVQWEVWAGSLPAGTDIYKISTDGTRLDHVIQASLENGRPAEYEAEDNFDTGYVPNGVVVNGDLVALMGGNN